MCSTDRFLLHFTGFIVSLQRKNKDYCDAVVQVGLDYVKINPFYTTFWSFIGFSLHYKYKVFQKSLMDLCFSFLCGFKT